MRTSVVTGWNSQGIGLPAFLLESINLKNNDAVEVVTENDSIVIKKIKKEASSIEELFEGFDGEYEPVHVNWGTPGGREIW